MIRLAHLLPAAMLGTLLAGCATHRYIPPPGAKGDASWQQVVPKDTVHYQLALGEVASGATPIQRVTPIYPVDQLVTCRPTQEVRALLIVDRTGKLSDVRVVDEAQADAARLHFISAVRVAAMQWQFSPLQINHWAADANGNSHVVDSETRPFSLTYAFRFACHGGKPAISSAPASG